VLPRWRALPLPRLLASTWLRGCSAYASVAYPLVGEIGVDALRPMSHNAVIPVLAESKRTEVMSPLPRRPIRSIAKLRGKFKSFVACPITERQARLGVNAIANDGRGSEFAIFGLHGRARATVF
jgi:hypothetical protein